MEPVSVESSPRVVPIPIPGAPRKQPPPPAVFMRHDRESDPLNLDLDLDSSDSDSYASLSPISSSPVRRRLNFHPNSSQPQPQFQMEESESSIGDCSVCYDALPLRANHVFTPCGHLFCVKCFLRWSDNSLKCPMCRREVASFDHELDQELDQEPEYTYSYLHIEEDAELVADTSFEMQTDPAHGDRISGITDAELELIQYHRLVISCIFLRNRFHETLFSRTTWGGRVQHTLIPKSEWLQMWENVPLYTQRAPAQMFEFVLRRNSQSVGYRRPNEEINTFGYIINPGSNEEEGSQLSFAFDVMVVTPTVPLGYHNIIEGRVETTLLTIPFEDIRRLYYVTSVEE